jgi:hypothetical protein
MEPLNLPRGSIRAALTLLLVAVSAALLFIPTVDDAGDVKSMFVLLTGIAVRDYFATREAQNAEDGPTVPPAVIGS